MSNERILVVDDEEDILELVRYNLAKEGYRVTSASTGEDALKKALSEKFDLIVLDLMLPDIDGVAVCTALRRDPETANTPILLLARPSATSGPARLADRYLSKPFRFTDLVSSLRELLDLDPINPRTVSVAA